MSKCAGCGMAVEVNEYHPYAACLMFSACGSSSVVKANLDAVLEKGIRKGKRLERKATNALTQK